MTTFEDVIVEPFDTNPEATIPTPVTLVFDNVTQSGTTTVTSEPIVFFPPSSGFALSSIMSYELESDAVFTGSVEVCFTYPGVTNEEADNEAQKLYKLFHYEDGQWVDITTSLDTINNQICGLVTSF